MIEISEKANPRLSESVITNPEGSIPLLSSRPLYSSFIEAISPAFFIAKLINFSKRCVKTHNPGVTFGISLVSRLFKYT